MHSSSIKNCAILWKNEQCTRNAPISGVNFDTYIIYINICFLFNLSEWCDFGSFFDWRWRVFISRQLRHLNRAQIWCCPLWPRPYSSARLALLCHPKPDPPEEPTGILEEKYYGGNMNMFHGVSMLNHFIRCCSGKYVVFWYTQTRSHKCPFFLYEVGSASAGFASSFTLRHVHVKFPWMKCESGGSWIAICLWVKTT